MCTAPAKALEVALVRAALARVIGVLHDVFEARFEKAKSAGEIAETADSHTLAFQETALLQSNSLRARRGGNAAELSDIARSIIAQNAFGNIR